MQSASPPVSLTPLGVITPLTMRFKLLFQQLYGEKVGWDDPLEGRLLSQWENLTSDLQQSTPISIPRCCTAGEDMTVRSYALDGFCDASLKAYAAVVYLRIFEDLPTSKIFPRKLSRHCGYGCRWCQCSKILSSKFFMIGHPWNFYSSKISSYTVYFSISYLVSCSADTPEPPSLVLPGSLTVT